MGTDTRAFLRDLARGLAPRADHVVDVVLQRLRGELPEVWEYEDIAVLAPLALSEHVTAVLDFLERDLDMTEVGTPPAAIEFACRVAEHGVPISQLLRIYRLVHAGVVHELYTETVRVTTSQELINATTVTLSAIGFEYADRTAEQAVAAYQRERDRLLQRRLIMINEAGRRIGTTLDTIRTAQELADVGADHFADLVTVDLLSSALPEESTYSEAGPPTLRRIAQAVSDGCPNPEFVTGQTYHCPEGSELARVLATGQPLRLRIAADAIPAWLAMSADTSRPCAPWVRAPCSWSHCGPREARWDSRSSSGVTRQTPSTTTSSWWPRRSRPEQRSTSTMPVATPRSAPPRSPSNAACCRSTCRTSPPSSRHRATCPADPERAWAVTGST